MLLYGYSFTIFLGVINRTKAIAASLRQKNKINVKVFLLPEKFFCVIFTKYFLI